MATGYIFNKKIEEYDVMDDTTVDTTKWTTSTAGTGTYTSTVTEDASDYIKLTANAGASSSNATTSVTTKESFKRKNAFCGMASISTSSSGTGASSTIYIIITDGTNTSTLLSSTHSLGDTDKFQVQVNGFLDWTGNNVVFKYMITTTKKSGTTWTTAFSSANVAAVDCSGWGPVNIQFKIYNVAGASSNGISGYGAVRFLSEPVR